MLKLIGIIIAAMPVVLFVRAILMGSKQHRARAVSSFRKQVDDAVWVILCVIGVAVVISLGKLLYDLVSAPP